MRMTEQEAKEMIRQNICSSSKCNDSCMYGKNRCQYEMAMSALEEVQQYRALGTVEELKEAKEKQIAKKPELIEGKMWTCPCCDNHLMHKWLKYPTELMPLSEGLPYCLSCGQKILWDWGNEDAE